MHNQYEQNVCKQTGNGPLNHVVDHQNGRLVPCDDFYMIIHTNHGILYQILTFLLKCTCHAPWSRRENLQVSTSRFRSYFKGSIDWPITADVSNDNRHLGGIRSVRSRGRPADVKWRQGQNFLVPVKVMLFIGSTLPTDRFAAPR